LKVYNQSKFKTNQHIHIAAKKPMIPFVKIKNAGLVFQRLKISAILLFLLALVIAFKMEPTLQLIIISNPLAVDRTNEVITIKRKVFEKKANQLFPLVKKANTTYTTQTLDLNNDGRWDELLIEVNLAAKSTDTLQVSWVKKNELPLFKKRTNVQLSERSYNAIASTEMNQAIRFRGFIQNIAKPFYQMEGPGIENDKVAFRSFFDYRNGKDIYGKIVDTPVLEKVGVGASWHQMQYWGKDILRVGNSLGAGALAVKEGEKIYPLADADTSFFNVVFEGALKAAFKLDFKNWDAGNLKKNGSETVSVSKGTFYYQNNIDLVLSQPQNLISGFANFGKFEVIHKKHNARFSSIATYGKQADGTDSNLGLAIMFTTDEYVEHATTDSSSSISYTSYVSLKPSPKKTLYFFACWEKTDKRFATAHGFAEYLQQTADFLAKPIKIKIINKK